MPSTTPPIALAPAPSTVAASPSSGHTHDPYRSVAREVLCVLADEDRPMSLRELQASGRLGVDDAAFQLSIARVAGFVRSVPVEELTSEPAYRPTTLGYLIAGRTRAARGLRPTRAMAAAQELRRTPALRVAA